MVLCLINNGKRRWYYTKNLLWKNYDTIPKTMELWFTMILHVYQNLWNYDLLSKKLWYYTIQSKFLNNYDYRIQICDGKNYGTMEKLGYYEKQNGTIPGYYSKLELAIVNYSSFFVRELTTSVDSNSFWWLIDLCFTPYLQYSSRITGSLSM